MDGAGQRSRWWDSRAGSRHEGAPTLAQTIATPHNNYNLVRLVLASSVIFFHSFLLTNDTAHANPADVALSRFGLDLGTWAVDAFFFLSGLFVAQSFHRDRSLANFVIRRFCRLWPGLFACVAITGLLACLIAFGPGHPAFLLDDGIYQYVLDNAGLQLVWTIPGVFDGLRLNAINGSIHTLPTEVKMYAGLALLGGLGALRNRAVLGAAACGVGLAFALHFDLLAGYAWLPAYGRDPTCMFCAGVAAFAVAGRLRVRPWMLPACIAAALLVPAPWGTAPALAATAAAMMLAGQAPLRWRPRTDLSYGVYIYGFPCQQFVLSVDPGLNPYAVTFLAMLPALGFAALSWRWVERPAIQFGRQLIALRRRDVPPAWQAMMRSPATHRFAALCLGLLVVGATRWGMAVRADLAAPRPLGVAITGFGPSEAKAGVPFNRQASGDSAFWLTFDKPPPEGTSIVLDGRRLATVLGPASASALVPAALVAQPGDKQVTLELRQNGRRMRSTAVLLHVTP